MDDLTVNANYTSAVDALASAANFVVITLSEDGKWKVIISDKVSHRTLLDIGCACSDNWLVDLVTGPIPDSEESDE